jgi:cytochrome b pre-mRNA-processing protein 3
LKVFKSEENEKRLQELYDFNFRQLELSIREIGYGDQSINKKMKDYINVFHGIISEIHFWNKIDFVKKKEKLAIFLPNFSNIKYLAEYFDDFNKNLSKNNLNSFIKGVSSH